MRVVFMGTPDFAAASLKKLIEDQFPVVGVFTQPDRPSGRGMALRPSPVKAVAQEHQIPVFQPDKLRDGTTEQQIRLLEPDILAVVAYGRILPDEILSIPKYGAVNVHASLLPKYRGAAPIQWAVLNGDAMTGVSTMYLAHEMDTGDIIYTRETPIGEKETSGELFDRLMVMGAELLSLTLHDIEAGVAPRSPQDHSKASYVSMLDKSMSPIDWSRPAAAIAKQIYGLQPWPVATMRLSGTVYRVFEADVTDKPHHALPGTVLSSNENGLLIACGDGKCLCITEIQAPGKKRMAVSDFLRGHKLTAGERCE